MPARPGADRRPPRVTRRRFLRTTAGAVGVGAMGGAGYGLSRLIGGGESDRGPRPDDVASALRVADFRSRPDLRPPRIRISGGATAAGYLLLGPGSTANSTQQGPLIVDEGGELLWFNPVRRGHWATNFRITTFRGRPALSWWQGKVIGRGFGLGEGVVVDSSYNEVARVRPGRGRRMDMHEFHLTPDGTALFTCYPRAVPMDLSPVGGPRNGTVLESIFQELDLRTGRVRLEWRSLDHVPITDSYHPLAEPYDYLHVNSIAIAPDGNLLVSARHTWALYKLDRRTGAVIWRLGGKSSDFQMGRGAQFSWQHDARLISPSTIALFDNGSDGPTTTESESRGLLLDVDTARRTVRLARAYRHPHRRLLASAMGSFQPMPGGHALIGWGTASYVSEFDADGAWVADAQLPGKLYSYRTYRQSWRATPTDRPALAVRRDPASGRSTVYVSWNGATEVARWRVRGGHRARHLETIAVAPRRGFETAIPLHGSPRWLAVTALDRSGRALAHSRAVSA